MSDPGEKPSAYDEAMALIQKGTVKATTPTTAAPPSPQATAPVTTGIADQPIGEDAPPGTTPPQSDPSLLQQVGDAVVGNVKDMASIVAGAVRAPAEVAIGGGQAASDLTDLLPASVAKPVKSAVGSFGHTLSNIPEVFPGQRAVGAFALMAGGGLNTKSAGDQNSLIAARNYLATIGDSAVNNGTAQLGSLILGAEGVDELRAFAFLPKLVKGAANFGVASALLTDPNAARLSASLKGLGIDNEFTNWLGAGPSQAPAWENRVKNGLENTLTGAAFDMTFAGLKWLRSVYAGAPDAAARQTAVDAAKQVIPEGAHPGDSKVTVDRRSATSAITVTDENGASRVAATIPKDQLDALQQETRGTLAAEDGSGVSKPISGGDAPPVPPEGSSAASPLPPLGNTDSIAPMLRAMAIGIHDTPHTVKSDADLLTFAHGIARDVGLDPVDILGMAQAAAGRALNIDDHIAAIPILWKKLASDVDGFAQRGVDSLSDPEVSQLKGAIHNAISFSGSVQDIRSGMGRGLRATAFIDGRDYVAGVGHNGGPLMDEGLSNAFRQDRPVPPLPETKQEIKDWLDMWSSTQYDPAGRQNFLNGIQTLPGGFKYLRSSFANMFTANALSGLPSVSMNVIGPGMMSVIQTVEKTLGGYTASLFAKTTADRRALMAVSNNAVRAYAQTMGDIPNAFRFALDAMKQERSILGGGNHLDVGRMGWITPGMIRASQDGAGLMSRGAYALGNLINVWPRAFQRVNSFLDEFASRLAYQGEIRLGAHTEGVQQGLAGDDLRDYVRNAMNTSVDAAGAATDEAALRAAGRSTMTNPLQSDYHPAVSRFADAVQAMRREVPESRYILTVFNVPANTLGESLRRIPGVNLLLSETRDELLGNLGPVRQADAYGRTMLGAAMLGYGFHLARAGLLTGPGPSNPHDRALWSQTHQPYSLRVSAPTPDNPQGTWLNYARYDTTGAILGILGTAFDHTVNNQLNDMTDMVMTASGALAQYFKDQGSMQGVSDLLDFGSGSGKTSAYDYAARLEGNTMTRLMVPNFVTQLGRNMVDPLKREKATHIGFGTDNIGQYLMDALPSTPVTPGSSDLDPVRNVMGEPIHIPRDTLLENVAPITLAPSNAQHPDAVLQELGRLYETSGYAAGVVHQADVSGGFYDARAIKLEDGRSLYDAVIRKRLDVRSPMGKTLRETLADTIASDAYQNKSVDAGAASMLATPDGKTSRGAALAQIFSGFDKLAQHAVAEESPIAKRYLAVTKAKQMFGSTLAPYGATDIAANPGIVKALGIDISKFEAGQ